MLEELNNELSQEDVIAEITADADPVAIVEAITEESVIVAEEPVKSKPALGPVEGGALGTTVIAEEPKKKPAAKPAKAEEKIAVFSTRNVTWNGVGKVYRGYNIVTQEQADKWVTRDHIRLATPQEVAKEFGL
jgi:hypothetical protein